MKTLSVPHPRINGFEVHVFRGKEVSASEALKLGGTQRKLNGPHHDAIWARDLLGTNISQHEHKRRRLIKGGSLAVLP